MHCLKSIAETIRLYDDAKCTKTATKHQPFTQNDSFYANPFKKRRLKNRLLNYTKVSYNWNYLSTKHSYFKGFRTGTTAVAGQETYAPLMPCVVLFPSRTFRLKIRIFSPPRLNVLNRITP